jgi:Tfp pilus assembly protein PilF/TolB-like protein
MPPAVGMRFGRYELLEMLGAGGMGEVYRARDHDLLRDVAVKFLPEAFTSSPERLARFTQEARTASALNHPNILTVHEIGSVQGQPFIVTELVAGRTLRDILRDGTRLSPKKALDYATQIADGLAQAHATGIVHRDLKPENVMVTPEGLVKILDFGLAKLQGPTSDAAAPCAGMSDLPTLAFEQAPPATSAGTVLGTAGYMSPEQARGRPVDHRSDQFALGTTLYEMATGRRAFDGETHAQAIAAIIEKEPEPITLLCPSFPAPARWIVERCLAKDPADRYASTLDLARELRGVREHLSEARKPGLAWAARPWAVEQARRLRGGLRPWHGLAAGAALAAAALLAAGPLRPFLAAWIESRTPLPAEKHVALLPFEVESPDPEDRFRADGLLEVMTSRLAQLEPLHAHFTVVPAGDVWQSGIATAEAARRAFDVNLVVTGRVERVDGRLRLVAQLEDAVHGKRLRTLPPREHGVEALSLQEDMTRAVARLLEVPLRNDESQVQEATPVAGAHADYVRARGHIQRFERKENVEEAISLLQRTLEQDPAYAPAYASLGEAYWRLYELTRRPELVDLARENCRKALALNELLSSVYVTLGIVERGTGEPEKALADLQRALDRDPRSADALRELGWTQVALGRTDRGEEALRRALALRSTDWSTHNYLGLLLLRQERFDEAEREFRRVIALNPEIPRGYSNLGTVCYREAKLDEAERMFRRSVEIRPTPGALSNLGTTLFYLARYGQAAEAFEKAVALDERNANAWLNLGRALFMSPGRREEAREPLERARALLEDQRKVNARDAEVLISLADIRAMSGRAEEARRLAARAVELAPGDGDVLAVAAAIHELAGDREAALRAIREALRAGYHRWEIERDPAFQKLRADPEYVDAVAGVPPHPGSH